MRTAVFPSTPPPDPQMASEASRSPIDIDLASKSWHDGLSSQVTVLQLLSGYRCGLSFGQPFLLAVVLLLQCAFMCALGCAVKCTLEGEFFITSWHPLRWRWGSISMNTHLLAIPCLCTLLCCAEAWGFRSLAFLGQPRRATHQYIRHWICKSPQHLLLLGHPALKPSGLFGPPGPQRLVFPNSWHFELSCQMTL